MGRLVSARVVVLLVTAGCVSCGGSSSSTSNSGPANPSVPADTILPGQPSNAESLNAESPSRVAAFPTFGVELTPPEGWVLDPVQPQSGFVGRWFPENASAEDWSQFAVQLTPLPEGRTARQAASVYERRGYVRSDARLGGAAAIRLDAPPAAAGNESSPTPSPLFIAKRGQYLWRLIFLLNDPADSAAVEQVKSNWRWLPRELAVGHLELGSPQTLFNGAGQLSLPAIARLDPSLSEADVLTYTAFDYRAEQDAIVVSCLRVDAVERDSLSGQAILYAEDIEQNTGIGEIVRFDQLPQRSNVYVSEVLRGEFDSNGKTVERTLQYAVWQPRTDAFVRIQVVVNNEVFSSDESIAAALEVVTDVFDSCSAIDATEASP